MSILSVLPLATESDPGAWPYIIAGSILLALVAAMLVLLSIGKGREHS